MVELVKNLDSGVDIESDLNSVFGTGGKLGTLSGGVNVPPGHDSLYDFTRDLQGYFRVQRSDSRVPFLDSSFKLFCASVTRFGLWVGPQVSFLDTGLSALKLA